MSRTLEILAKPPKGTNIKLEFSQFLTKARDKKWNKLSVMFGFAWANYIYDTEWIEQTFTPDELEAKVQSIELNDDGKIGDDDLYITIPNIGVHYTFCHENDIHLEGSTNSKYILAEKNRYQSLGWQVYERYNIDGNKGELTLINSAQNTTDQPPVSPDSELE